MNVQYEIVATIVNLRDGSTSKFQKTLDVDITAATDALLYNNYHIIARNVRILDLFEDEVSAYTQALGVGESSIQVDEFEVVSLHPKADVFFEFDTKENEMSLKPTIKCYIHPKNEALPAPTLRGMAYDSHTIIWEWDDDGCAHYLVEEAIDITNDADKSKILAHLPVGVTSYTETGLESDTAYIRRIIAYTDEQTSLPSSSCTVRTETVEPEYSVEEYSVPRNYDFTTDDAEREIIQSRMKAFHSGVGDFTDLKVYKQMDADFYQKFKAYFEITGRRLQREKRYDQVGFNYKFCMEAMETIEEQEGEVTFDIFAYPREWVTLEDYVWATQPVKILAKFRATVFLGKEGAHTEEEELVLYKPKIEDTTTTTPNPPVEVTKVIGDPLHMVIVWDETMSMYYTAGGIIEGLTTDFTGAAAKINETVNALNTCISNIKNACQQVGVDFECKLVMFCGSDGTNNTAYRKKPPQAFDKNLLLADANNSNGNYNYTTTNWNAGIAGAKAAISSMGGGASNPNLKKVCVFMSDGSHTTSSHGEVNANELKNAFDIVIPVICDCYKPGPVNYSGLGIGWEGTAGQSTGAVINSGISNGDKISKDSAQPSGKYLAPTGNTYILWKNPNDLVAAFTSIFKYVVTTEYKPTDPTIINKQEFKGWEKQPEEVVRVTTFDLSEVKAVEIESDQYDFEFNSIITPEEYVRAERRTIIPRSSFLSPTKMCQTNLYDLIMDKVKMTPEWAEGYNQPVGIDGRSNGGSFLIKGLYIKDSYKYADEDNIIDGSNFGWATQWDALEDGMEGTVNVFTDIDKAGTTTYGDDCYLVSKNNYLMIQGYTDAIIYDGTRFVNTELNALDHPEEVIVSPALDQGTTLINRKKSSLTYSGNGPYSHCIDLLRKDDDIFFVGIDLGKVGSYIVLHPLTGEVLAKITRWYKSPILNYRFNLEDPDAKTPIREILPDCDSNNTYRHIVLLHVYYARNVWITNKDNYVKEFGDDPIATLNSPYIAMPLPQPLPTLPKVEGYYQWTKKEWDINNDNISYKKDDNGWYIDHYLWFMAKPMTKTQPYYNELPGENMPLFYGLVNGRYRQDNQDGKKDLIVDAPQFNIPTTVHKDTIQIYAVMSEFYPKDALVSYRWEHPYNNHDDITQHNGCYITFSCDSITWKDQEYYDVISTINIENQEVFDNKTTESIFQLEKPDTLYTYINYYLKVTTDNSDVIALRYPTEITFDENNLAEVGVAFKGVVNATTKWSPRIHNGYYYLNQHEYFAYSEFNVKANFDTYEETNFKRIAGYVSFDVYLRHLADPPEDYHIVKNTRSSLLQDETKFKWVNGKGLTLRPSIDGVYYREYEPYEYISPVIMFPNKLTHPGVLNVDYYFEDGSTFMQMEVRSYDLDKGEWGPWEPFYNNTVPNVDPSHAYQVKMYLQASVSYTPLYLEDYLCCYLDWKDDGSFENSTNIVTITDHMTTGNYPGDGIFVSKVFDYGCDSEVSFDIFESNYNKRVSLFIASSNNKDELLLENVKWHRVPNGGTGTVNNRYVRYKLVIPEGEKVYWLHKYIVTLETHELLPYVTGILMDGRYEPSDVVTNFINTEAFEIPKDGQPHEIFARISDVIGADVLEHGYQMNEVEKVNIQCTTPNVQIGYNNHVNNKYPGSYLDAPMTAQSDIDVEIQIKNTPFIFVERDELDEHDVVIIEGTPQQYCPITVEDPEGHTYIQLHNQTSFLLNKEYLTSEPTKYVEIPSNRYDPVRMKVFLDGQEINKTDYDVVNHLIIFHDFIGIAHKITIEYCILYSFIANIDRENNKTTLYLHTGENIPIPEKVKVFFETNLRNNKFVANQLSLNPIYRTDYKGFIYLTDDHNDVYSINMYCNPCRLQAGGYDKVDIQIEVLDIKGNPVIEKEVAVDCDSGILICESYITDMNGVIHILYQSSYFATTDTVKARVLTDDGSVIEKSITIINE